MSKRLLIGIALVVMSVSVVGAASYTSASVTRDATIGVEADDKAIIGLTEGDVPGISQNTAGQLQIDLDEDADGLNTEATFEYGDTSFDEPTDDHAFSINNNAGSSYAFTLSYGDIASDGPGDNVFFYVYDSSGNLQGSDPVTETNSRTFTADPTETYYVVIVIDTSGVTSSADLTGRLTITASPSP